MTTMAQGSASLLRLVELACTNALGTQLTAAETAIAVRNLNIPAKFDLLNSGKGNLPGEMRHLWTVVVK